LCIAGKKLAERTKYLDRAAHDKWKVSPGFAEGGFVSRPTLSMIGEAGREAVIPLSGNRGRAAGLWKQAGRELGFAGAGGGDITLHYAPVIHGGSGPEVRSALLSAKDELVKTLRELMRDERRRGMMEG